MEEEKNRSPFLIEPDESASFEEWQEWALKLRDKVQTLTLEEKKRVTQLRGLRKELKKKNKVLGIYKQIIRELEEKVKKYEISIFFELRESIKQYIQKKRNL